MRFVTGKAWSTSARRRWAFRTFATVVGTGRVPQTFIEKVVQKYAVNLPPGKTVKAGDYVMLRPEHVMTHDNTGPVISKCALCPLRRNP
jgi:homoaconitate hydratase